MAYPTDVPTAQNLAAITDGSTALTGQSIINGVATQLKAVMDMINGTNCGGPGGIGEQPTIATGYFTALQTQSIAGSGGSITIYPDLNGGLLIDCGGATGLDVSLGSYLQCGGLEFRGTQGFYQTGATSYIKNDGGYEASYENITSASGGTAASAVLETTFITTNGDQDLDNVTLADGAAAGVIKRFAIKAQGDALDTVKITPANFAGGTQITFSAPVVGKGCIMVFDGTNWVVASKNGGTIA